MNVLADKASRLFQFLADVQSEKERPIRRMSEYGNEADWLLLKDIRETAESSGLKVTLDPRFENGLESGGQMLDGSSPEDDSAVLLQLSRPSVPAAPAIPDDLVDLVEGPVDNPGRRPTFQDASSADSNLTETVQERIEGWLDSWDSWAAATRAHELYQRFFQMQVKATQQADEYELVFGVGWLTWALEASETVDRPIFFTGVDIEMDKRTGAIAIRQSAEPLKAELEALPTGRIQDGRFVEELKEYLAEFDGNVVNAADFEKLGLFTVNGLSTNSICEPLAAPRASDGRPVMTWSPILILRPRRRIGLSSTFREIAQEIERSGEVPDGLRPLVDPGYETNQVASDRPGALFDVGGELFSPLPLNDRQRRVIDHVDSHAHTIVQGPPGTGKTHMAAALLSHLLAQGKKVLVTADKERALYELRDKLPPEIRELAVSVIGSSTQEMAELRTSIDTIERRSSSFDEVESAARIRRLEAELAQLSEERVRILRGWASELEHEQAPLDATGYALPLPQAIEKLTQEQDRFGWIDQLGAVEFTKPFPLTRDEVDELLRFLDDPSVASRPLLNEESSLDPACFPSPVAFATLVQKTQDAREAAERTLPNLPERLLEVWQGLGNDDRVAVCQAIQEIAVAGQSLQSFTMPWTQELRPDASSFEINTWQERVRVVLDELKSSESDLAQLQTVRRISVSGDRESLVPVARNLREYLSSGKTLNFRADGTVKAPLLGGGAVKAAAPFVDAVRINGMPPASVEMVDQFLVYVSVGWELQTIEKHWPYVDFDYDDPVMTVQAVETDLQRFQGYLESLGTISDALERLRDCGFQVDYREAIDLARLADQLNRSQQALANLQATETEFFEAGGGSVLATYSGLNHPWIEKVRRAIAQPNAENYSDALENGREFHEATLKRRKLSTSLDNLASWSSELARKVKTAGLRVQWAPRLYEAEQARQWHNANVELSERTKNGRHEGLRNLERVDGRIENALSELAAERAWFYAAGSERIDGSMRANMKAYAHAVRRLGKGTGKHAEQNRRNVRRHLESASGAVPVWIMPIRKVVEQFDLKQNMFDVVVVDEASQASLEAIFLQYLAPKIVVVGDNYQVSPEAVGTDLEALQNLGRQYLYDFDKVDAWIDPKRSLFDEADMRYGGRISLEEHRRCVPEIIEFSNELVYRPNKIELKPVRAIEADRLAPFRITRTPNAFETGKNKVNRAEADTLVDRLIGILDDPEYNGKTIGVISLLSSSGQADYIQKRLIEALPPQIWQERDLKVGKPADFQGAERDVIFLSMVTPVPGEGRLATMAMDRYEQRYNVAVSRAKDQVWLFHSIGVEDFTNHDDVRYKLLEYAYRVAEAAPQEHTSQLVPFDTKVEPFDSLFEQRVYNELVRRGYYVIPQFDVFGRRIDLVVEGERDRLAVECDGDYWHSEEFAIADQSRQRELERLGWVFVRVFESDFYLDKEEQIRRIVNRLDEMGIKPGQGEDDVVESGDNVEIVESVYG